MPFFVRFEILRNLCFLFSDRKQKKNHPNEKKAYPHQKVKDIGFHMRQSASKSARTANREKLLKLGSPFEFTTEMVKNK